MSGGHDGSNSSPEVEEEEEEEICGPLVFQCGTCQAIVGDSLSFVEALQQLDVIILRGECFRLPRAQDPCFPLFVCLTTRV
jgi:hypothetical protein